PASIWWAHCWGRRPPPGSPPSRPGPDPSRRSPPNASSAAWLECARRLEPRDQLPQERSQVPPLRATQRGDRLSFASRIDRDRLVKDFAAGFCDLDQHAPPIGRVSLPLEVASALQPVEPASDAGSRKHQTLEQLGG